MLVFLFLMNAFLGNAHDTLAERWRQLDIRPGTLFYAPHTPEEQWFYDIGRVHFSQKCESALVPGALPGTGFRGYIPLADPYHSGRSKISFLIGTDCSRLVHRLFQLLGAEFPYAKTRHFLHVLKRWETGTDPTSYYEQCAQKGYALDLSRSNWLRLVERFEVLEPGAEPQEGDVWVSAVEQGGVLGRRGHVAVVSQTGGRTNTHVLHARNSRQGLVDESLQEYLRRFPQSWALRFRGPLKARDFSKGLFGLLSLEWPENVR